MRVGVIIPAARVGGNSKRHNLCSLGFNGHIVLAESIVMFIVTYLLCKRYYCLIL